MTTLRLYNTLSRTKEDFVPLDPANLRMYVCGPTVYDYAHIGNARPAIVFDVLFRLLRHLHGPEHVTYVRNITDIDDKINARALELQKAEPGKPILDIVRALTVETAKIYEADMAALGCLPPTHSPRATAHIPQMIAMIAALIEAGHAYAKDGHVLFDVSSKPDYGKLAKRSVDDMIAGARVDPAPYKKSPMDFVLWKPSDAQTPGWESPWGFGRPGWHLECSAMSAEYLGETFDIHGGGIDLVFPHHENEVAQSEGAHHNHPFARVWMHNGHLQVEGAKMSKSLGNFVTVHDLLKDWPGDVLRLNMLRTHYRQPMDWTVHGLEESQRILSRWRARYEDVAEVDWFKERSVNSELIEALCDDLNTPLAISRLHELDARIRSEEQAADFATNLIFLGLEPDWVSPGQEARRRFDPLAFEQGVRELVKAYKGIEKYASRGMRVRDWSKAIGVFNETKIDINREIEARNAARKAKNFAESDRIRDELDAKGIVLKDGPTGTTWEVKR